MFTLLNNVPAVHTEMAVHINVPLHTHTHTHSLPLTQTDAHINKQCNMCTLAFGHATHCVPSR